jgi:hypothetical protein
MFAETEYMLWDRDETEKRAALEISRRADAFAPTPGPDAHGPQAPRPPERAGPSSGLVPPALRDSAFSLEETEARAAINWVNWLQAQGARPHGNAPTGPLREVPSRVSLPSLPLESSALPQATPEALRQMFAVLESEVTPERIVEGEVIVPSPEQALGDDTPTSPRVVSRPAPTPLDSPSDGDASVGTASEDGAASRRQTGAPAAVTLETLERSFAASGFQSFELAPGSLSSFASEAPGRDEEPTLDAAPASLNGAPYPAAPYPAAPYPAAPEMAAPEMAAPEMAAPEMAMPEIAPLPTFPAQTPTSTASSTFEPLPDAVPEPTVAPVLLPVATPYAADSPAEAPRAADPPEPDDDDYDARLARARRWQAEARTTESLAEYRSILKYAPALLPDVMQDLRQRVAEAPEDAEAHRLLGDAYVRQGEYLGALEAYNRAVALTDSGS